MAVSLPRFVECFYKHLTFIPKYTLLWLTWGVHICKRECIMHSKGPQSPSLWQGQCRQKGFATFCFPVSICQMGILTGKASLAITQESRWWSLWITREVLTVTTIITTAAHLEGGQLPRKSGVGEATLGMRKPKTWGEGESNTRQLTALLKKWIHFISVGDCLWSACSRLLRTCPPPSAVFLLTY